MNKIGKAKELSLGACLFLIIAGIVFLSASSSDPTAIFFFVGILFLIVGIIGLIVVITSWFKR